METTTINQFYIIGVAVRTTNQGGQSGVDIPQLWHKFMSEQRISKIPGRVKDTVYAVYTDYESDYTQPYTTILGCRVENLDRIPESFTGITVHTGPYLTFTAKGKMADNIVFAEWTKIWNTDLPRAYTADFEVYDERSSNPDKAIVDIYIGVK